MKNIKSSLQKLLSSRDLLVTSLLILLFLIVFQSSGAAPTTVNGEGGVGTIGKWVSNVSVPMCGQSAGVPSETAPTTDLCDGGTPTEVQQLSDNWQWECRS